MKRLEFDAIGTRWTIDYDGLPGADEGNLEALIHETIETFDRSFSRFRADSWVSKVRASAGTYQLPPDGYELLLLYRLAYAVSDGLVTPLVGSALEQAGYDAGYSLVPRTIQPVVDMESVVSFDEMSVTTTEPVLFDFGAAGKGYLVDKVGDVLEAAGVTTFVINAGGDILRKTPDQNRMPIGLENPFDTTQAVGVAHLGSGSICGSSGNRRAWAGYTHIMNPRTLSSPTQIAAVWARADTAAVADLLTTALYFVAPERLRDSFSFEYAMLDTDMRLRASKGFDAELFVDGATS